MSKVYGSAKEALDGLLFDGVFIAAGGFGRERGRHCPMADRGIFFATFSTGRRCEKAESEESVSTPSAELDSALLHRFAPSPGVRCWRMGVS